MKNSVSLKLAGKTAVAHDYQVLIKQVKTDV